MNYDEARIKHQVLLAQIQRLDVAVEWEQIRRMERLQNSLQVVRARLGLRPAPAD